MLRKKILNLPDYHLYDGSIPIVDFDKLYPYEEAKTYVAACIKPLGKEYETKMNTALAEGWIDVYETPGKRSGAYSSNVYGVHPYMLMNYNETLDQVFTLAHELGHTIHTILASENQPFATHDYTIFVAEVASTLNERLLLDYMLSKTKDPKERIALLQQAISNITGTFYFQTMLADFEWQVHQLVEQGQPITSDKLKEITAQLDSTYYGDAVAVDELYHYVWSRIPHFYRTPFYVYQYATCFASSARRRSSRAGPRALGPPAWGACNPRGAKSPPPRAPGESCPATSCPPAACPTGSLRSAPASRSPCRAAAATRSWACT